MGQWNVERIGPQLVQYCLRHSGVGEFAKLCQDVKERRLHPILLGNGQKLGPIYLFTSLVQNGMHVSEHEQLECAVLKSLMVKPGGDEPEQSRDGLNPDCFPENHLTSQATPSIRQCQTGG